MSGGAAAAGARRLRVRAALLLAFAVLAAPFARPAEAQSQQELDALRERIRAERERVEGHEAQERAIFERLEEIEQAQAALEAQVRRARHDARSARAALEEIERESTRLEERLVQTRAAMRRRAVALYKAGQAGPVRALFAAGSLREMLQRLAGLRVLLAHDVSLVARFDRDRSAYAAARVDAQRAAGRHERAAAVLARERAALERERAARRTLLASVRADRTRERALLVELEKAARALEATLESLGESGGGGSRWLAGSGFAARRGALPAPVDAPITAGFGRVVDRDFQTQTVRNGVEFGAPRGQPVRATARGEVRFAGWFRGYGRIVIVDHGDDFFSISGHLGSIEVAVGERVEARQVLGAVGDTGSLTGPSLYFELRRGGEPLDPAQWLAAESVARAR